MPFLPYLPDLNEHLKHLSTAIEISPYAGDRDLNIGTTPRLPASAAEDISVTGKDAIWGVIGTRTTADALSLSAQQAEAIARNSKIAAVRMLEALKTFNEFVWKGQVFEAQMKLAKLPTREDKIKWEQTLRDIRNKKPPAFGFKPPLPGLDNPPFKFEDYTMQKDLKEAFASCRTVARDNKLASALAAQFAATAANAAHAAAQAANLPGLQPTTWSPQVFKPPKRPRDLAPFWLDLPYAGSKGADPYMVATNEPRRGNADLLRATSRFNPFEGTVPMGERLRYDQVFAGKPLWPFFNGIGRVPIDMGVDIPIPEAAHVQASAKSRKLFAQKKAGL